jgi:cytochrome P450
MFAVKAEFVPPTVRGLDRPLPVRKFLPAFIRNPLATLPQAAYEDPFVIIRANKRTTVYVCDPALIERFLLDEANETPKTPLEKRVLGPTLGDGILTSQGPSWRWQRRTAAPLFRPGDINGLVPLMSHEAEAQVAAWRKLPPGTSQPIDRDMTETTFRVISATMFAGAADSEGRTIQDAADQMLRWVSWELAFGLVGIPKWVWHPGKLPRALASKRMRAAVHTILKRRRAAGIDGNDLMARLAAAMDPETGQPMNEEQIVDNMLTFLAAGHETTAKALTWTLYLLANATDWQERVRTEVLAVAGNEPITHAHLERMPITRQVMKESMRLYPPAGIMSRMLTKPTGIGDETFGVGTILVFPIYAIHRHKKLWKDPDRFDPTRFTPEQEKTHARAQFMPFGFGPRLCIGMSFAMIEAQVLLATFVRGAKFSWDGKYVPEPVNRVTLRPRDGMPLIVTPLG